MARKRREEEVASSTHGVHHVRDSDFDAVALGFVLRQVPRVRTSGEEGVSSGSLPMMTIPGRAWAAHFFLSPLLFVSTLRRWIWRILRAVSRSRPRPMVDATGSATLTQT